MRKKIVGILVCALMIVATVLPVAGTMNKNEEKSSSCQLLILDVGVEEITSPDPSCFAPSVQSIEAIIKNYGDQPASGIKVEAEIYEFITNPSSGTLVYQDDVFAVDLNPNNVATVTFADFHFALEGKYELTVCTELAGDVNPSNDCLTLEIFVDDTAPWKLFFYFPFIISIWPPPPICKYFCFALVYDYGGCGIDRVEFYDSPSPAPPFSVNSPPGSPPNIWFTWASINKPCGTGSSLYIVVYDTAGNHNP